MLGFASRRSSFICGRALNVGPSVVGAVRHNQIKYPMMDGADWQNADDLIARVDEMFSSNLPPAPKVLRAIMTLLGEQMKNDDMRSFYSDVHQGIMEQMIKQLGKAAAGDVRQKVPREHPIVEALVDGLLVHGNSHQAVELAMEFKGDIEKHLQMATGGFGVFGNPEKLPEVHGRIAVVCKEALGPMPLTPLTKHYDGIVVPFTALRQVQRQGESATGGGPAALRATWDRVRLMVTMKTARSPNGFVRVLPFIHQLSSFSALPFAATAPGQKEERQLPVSRMVKVEQGPNEMGEGAVPAPKKGSKQYLPVTLSTHSSAVALFLQKNNPHTEFHVVTKDINVLHSAKVCRAIAVNFPSELPVKAPIRRGEGTPGEPQIEPNTRGAKKNMPGAGSYADGEYGKSMAKPTHEDPIMRVVIDNHPSRLTQEVQTRDVVIMPNVFNQPGDETMYDRLLSELKAAPVDQENLIQRWHSDSHFIADDSIRWKKECPTFIEVINRMRNYFGLTVTKTRFNWYKDTSDWKPLHHDAAAIKADKAAVENFTIGATFGATREAIFEETNSKRVISFSLDNGAVYCFARDINVLWKHGIRQEATFRDEGRISIIIWGWIDQTEV